MCSQTPSLLFVAYCQDGYAFDSSSQCAQCEVGYYKDNAANGRFSNCTQCPDTFTSRAAGATSVDECTIGQYAPHMSEYILHKLDSSSREHWIPTACMCSLLKLNAWPARSGLKPPTVVRSALEGATSRCHSRRSVCPAPAARPPLTLVPPPALTVWVRHRMPACGSASVCVCQLVVRIVFGLMSSASDHPDTCTCSSCMYILSYARKRFLFQLLSRRRF